MLTNYFYLSFSSFSVTSINLLMLDLGPRALETEFIFGLKGY